MTTQRSTTAGSESVRAIAGNALASAEGLRVNFSAAKYGGHDGAKRAARSFQASFCAIRARDRNLHATRALGERGIAKFTEARSRYDSLSCMVREEVYNGGWYVLLQPSAAMLMELDVTDLKGNPIPQFTTEALMWESIGAVLSRVWAEGRRTGVKPTNPLTPDETAWLYAQGPEKAIECFEMNEVVVPKEWLEGRNGTIMNPYAPNSEFDPANATDDDLANL